MRRPSNARAGAGRSPGVMVSNGPFVLKKLSINGPIELERNPRYWDAASVRLQKVTYYSLPDSAAATSRYLAGDLDVTDRFQMEDFDWLRESLGDEVRIGPYFGVVMLAMHTKRPPFDSAPLRRAMVLAIDREMIVKHLMKGQYEAAYGIVPPLPGYPAFRPEWADLAGRRAHRTGAEILCRSRLSRRASSGCGVQLFLRQPGDAAGVRGHGRHVAPAPGRQCEAGGRGLARAHAEPGHRQDAPVLVVLDCRLSGSFFLPRAAHRQGRPEL